MHRQLWRVLRSGRSKRCTVSAADLADNERGQPGSIPSLATGFHVTARAPGWAVAQKSRSKFSGAALGANRMTAAMASAAGVGGAGSPVGRQNKPSSRAGIAQG